MGIEYRPIGEVLRYLTTRACLEGTDSSRSVGPGASRAHGVVWPMRGRWIQGNHLRLHGTSSRGEPAAIDAGKRSGHATLGARTEDEARFSRSDTWHAPHGHVHRLVTV
jgi:hypothetical protein